MKRSMVIAVALGVLLIGVLAIILVPAREPVSLTFVQYLPGAEAAKLKLTNISSKTITYLTDEHGGAVLALPKASTGSTNSMPEILTGTMTPPTGKPVPTYFFAVPGFVTNGGRFEVLRANDLKPGQSAQLYVWFEADGSPTRVGTVCIIPQGKLAQQFGRWINRVKSWCHMKSKLPGQFEVWCSEPLQISSSPTRKEQQ